MQSTVDPNQVNDLDGKWGVIICARSANRRETCHAGGHQTLRGSVWSSVHEFVWNPEPGRFGFHVAPGFARETSGEPVDRLRQDPPPARCSPLEWLDSRRRRLTVRREGCFFVAGIREPEGNKPTGNRTTQGSISGRPWRAAYLRHAPRFPRARGGGKVVFFRKPCHSAGLWRLSGSGMTVTGKCRPRLLLVP